MIIEKSDQINPVPNYIELISDEYDETTVKAVEDLLNQSIKDSSIDSSLQDTIRIHGWSGKNFDFREDEKWIMKHSLKNSIENLFFKKEYSLALPLESVCLPNYKKESNDTLIIKSYCSDTLLNILKKANLKHLKKNLKYFFQGACLVADISGFTKLSAKLCDEGVSGLDKLHSIMKEYIGNIINIVYSYCGDGKIFIYKYFIIYISYFIFHISYFISKK